MVVFQGFGSFTNDFNNKQTACTTYGANCQDGGLGGFPCTLALPTFGDSKREGPRWTRKIVKERETERYINIRSVFTAFASDNETIPVLGVNSNEGSWKTSALLLQIKAGGGGAGRSIQGAFANIE